jgi:hypothetical protein
MTARQLLSILLQAQEHCPELLDQRVLIMGDRTTVAELAAFDDGAFRIMDAAEPELAN